MIASNDELTLLRYVLMLLSVSESAMVRTINVEGAWEACESVEVGVVQEVEKEEVVGVRSQRISRVVRVLARVNTLSQFSQFLQVMVSGSEDGRNELRYLRRCFPHQELISPVSSQRKSYISA